MRSGRHRRAHPRRRPGARLPIARGISRQKRPRPRQNQSSRSTTKTRSCPASPPTAEAARASARLQQRPDAHHADRRPDGHVLASASICSIPTSSASASAAPTTSAAAGVACSIPSAGAATRRIHLYPAAEANRRAAPGLRSRRQHQRQARLSHHRHLSSQVLTAKRASRPEGRRRQGRGRRDLFAATPLNDKQPPNTIASIRWPPCKRGKLMPSPSPRSSTARNGGKAGRSPRENNAECVRSRSDSFRSFRFIQIRSDSFRLVQIHSDSFRFACVSLNE